MLIWSCLWLFQGSISIFVMQNWLSYSSIFSKIHLFFRILLFAFSSFNESAIMYRLSKNCKQSFLDGYCKAITKQINKILSYQLSPCINYWQKVYELCSWDFMEVYCVNDQLWSFVFYFLCWIPRDIHQSMLSW